MLMVGGLVLFLVLLYVMEASPGNGFLSPLLVAAAGTIVLWPLRKLQSARALMLAGGFLLLLWFMAKISTILIPFVVVYLLAYLLDPAVQFLRKRYGIRRWLSSLMVSLLVVGTLAAFILILAPSVASQVQSLTERLLNALSGWQTWLETAPVLDNLEAAGLIDKQDAVAQLTAFIQTQAGQLPEALRLLGFEATINRDYPVMFGTLYVFTLLGLITTLALVPVILFYTLKDYPYLKRGLIELFPTREGRRDYLIDAGSIVGNYLRGQLIISFIAAFNVSLLFFIFDVPFWLLLGLLAGIFNFIPNLGAILTLLIAGTVTFIFGGWVKVFVAVAVLTGQALLEQSVLTPNILSYQVGLHPVLVLLSLLTFGTFLGVFGLLIAVPATAILVTAYRAYREELTLELRDYTSGNGV